jgi:hypothetical protein
MKKVTKEWLWLMSAVIGSFLCVVALITGGVRPRESLPMGIYVILFPIALVYFIRLTVWAVKGVLRRARRK